MRIPHGLRAALAGQGSTPAPSTDANFENTVLLLHGDGTNGAQNNTFTDGSTNNFTITRSGNATQGTFSPYGDNWSNYFDGTGDYLRVTNGSFLTFTGDFTVEGWIYSSFSGGTGVQGFMLIDTRSGYSTSNWAFGVFSSTGAVQFFYSGGGLSSSVSCVPNAWNHIALTRSGTTLKMFVNGVEGYSGTVSGTIATGSNANATIGAGFDGANYMSTGYCAGLRVVNGTAVYTSNFTPSTTPLAAITNTSLLTCQSNRFRDASTNNFTITRNGDVSVQRFSPFSPAAAYSSSTIGGSGYFDGTGDNVYCTPSNLTGQYTIEGWFYQTDNAGTKAFFGNWSTGCLLRVQSGISFEWYMPGSSLTATIVSQKNQWFHAAITRDSGNTVRLFLNGTQVASNTSSSTITMTNFTVGSERSVSGDPYAGYISGFRILNGTALYTSAFTPPTTPPTAIANTNLLLNFTNGGIIDNTMMNDVETVGNAQISTTVKKYGTGSMYFDGTGDWLLLPHTTDHLIGTGKFTIEFWLYLSATGAARGLVGKGTSTTGWLVSIDSSNKVVFTYGSSTITSSGALSGSTWYYVTVVREGTSTNQTKIYIDGTNDGTGTVSTDFTQTNAMYVGANRTAGDALNGYIDDLRITKGVARYTANFTPPTAALPDL
jgi:hypothetical protein